MASFVDKVTLHLRAGNGGNGCVSVRREKYKPLGGPDGANGGHGGSIIFEVDSQESTLMDYHHTPHRSAENGQPGAGDNQRGKNGADLVLKVPAGTVVKNSEGDVLADLVSPGDSFEVARGGVGGLGNAALASPRRKAPGFALLGEAGEELDVVLELKSVADVALVGFPSAGKSSLIAAMSAARPKIADYPFTTLVPNLGVVTAGEERYTIADVPGLIPGASEGRGLGLEFLRHIERCAVIAHVIDCATLEPGRDPLTDLDTLEHELARYAANIPPTEGQLPLTERPRVVILNKIDVPDARELAEFVTPELRERGLEVFAVSTASHEGLRELSFYLARVVREEKANREVAEPVRPVLHLTRERDDRFTIVKRRDGMQEFWNVRGRQPERWVGQTDFANDEAVGYLGERLHRLGIEDELARLGAVPGDMVVIGPPQTGFVFDWEPTVAAVAEIYGPRGRDIRVEAERSRPTRREKRADFYERMDAKEEARQELRSEREAGIWADPQAGTPEGD